MLIEIRNPKAKKLIDDLIDLELISLSQSTNSSWSQLWAKLDSKLPQTESNITESEVIEEIKAYRAEKKINKLPNP